MAYQGDPAKAQKYKVLSSVLKSTFREIIKENEAKGIYILGKTERIRMADTIAPYFQMEYGDDLALRKQCAEQCVIWNTEKLWLRSKEEQDAFIDYLPPGVVSDYWFIKIKA